MFFRSTPLAICLFLLATYHSIAQWNPDPSVNTPLCVENNWQSPAGIFPDGNGGVYAAWLDNRNSTEPNMYALYTQRIARDGIRQWDPQGLQICDSVPFEEYFTLIPSVNNRFIFLYERNINITGNYCNIAAQCRNSDGLLLWQTDYVFTNSYFRPQHFTACPDGNGGAFVFQSFSTNIDNGNIHAQHIDMHGNIRWGAHGICIAGESSGQTTPVALAGPEGSAYIAWEDDTTYRASKPNNILFVQRIDSNGTMLWGNDPLCISSTKKRYESFQMKELSNGDVVIAWADMRGFNAKTESRHDDTVSVYAQSFDMDGNILWDSTGICVSAGMPLDASAGTDVRSIQVAAAPSGQSLIAWTTKSGIYYIQKLNAEGALRFNSGQVLTLTRNTSHAYYRFGMVSDGNGGAYESYIRQLEKAYSLLSLHVDYQGAIDWIEKPITTAPGIKDIAYGSVMQNMVPDDNGGFFIAWGDGRTDIGDTYITRINGYGNSYPVTLSLFSGQYTGSSVALTWCTESERNNAGFMLQRSANGISWIDRAFIKASPYTIGGSIYTHDDVLSVSEQRNDTWSYRLIQKDTDGSVSYSPVISVHVAQPLSVTLEILALSPQPAGDNVSIQCTSSSDGNLTISIVDMLGNTVLQTNVDGTKGVNAIPLHLAHIPAGLYFARISDGKHTAIQKLLRH